jgi:hypothetical protein
MSRAASRELITDAMLSEWVVNYKEAGISRGKSAEIKMLTAIKKHNNFCAAKILTRVTCP